MLLGRIISFDYGTKYIGVAISDPLQIATRPLPRILNHSPTLNSNILSIISKFSPSLILIGYPKNNKTNYIHEEINLFYKRIHHLYPNTKINLVNEAFSSQKAESLIDQMTSKKVSNEKSRKKRKEILDSKSAQVILYQYLQNRKIL